MCEVAPNYPDTLQVTKSIENFGNNLFHELSKKEKGNLVCSPFSLHTVLSVLLQGAHSTTFQALKNGLKINDN